MRLIIKNVCVILVILTSMLSFSACGSSSDGHSLTPPKVTSEGYAIYLAMNDYGVEKAIAERFDFVFYDDPVFSDTAYSKSKASKNSDGSWNVELVGTISGRTDYGSKNVWPLRAHATVLSSGYVCDISVETRVL